MATAAPELDSRNDFSLSTFESSVGPAFGLLETRGGWRARIADNIVLSFGRTVTTSGYKLGFNVWDVDDSVWDNPQITMRNSVELNDGTLQIAASSAASSVSGTVWWDSTLRRLAYMIPAHNASGHLDVNNFAYGLVEFDAAGVHTVLGSGTLTVTGGLAYVTAMDHLLLAPSADLATIQGIWMASAGTGTGGNMARQQLALFDLAAGTGDNWPAATAVPPLLGMADAHPNNWTGYERGVAKDYTAVGDSAGVYTEVVIDAAGTITATAHDWAAGSAVSGVTFVVDRHLPFSKNLVVGADTHIGQHVGTGFESALYSGTAVTAWATHLPTFTRLCDWWSDGTTEAYGQDGTGTQTLLRVAESLGTVYTVYKVLPTAGTAPLRTEGQGRYRWSYSSDFGGQVQVFYQGAVPPAPEPITLPGLEVPPLRIPFPLTSRAFDWGTS